jgi:hypothetical protein
MAQKFIFLIILVMAVGCSKPNPTPELLDPIYSDIASQVSAVESEIAAEEIKLSENQSAYDNVVPQTGQIKFGQKRVWDSKNRLEKLKQLKKYWEVRKESRKIHSRIEYLKAYNKGKPWPEASEYSQYKAQQKLENNSRSWNVKKRIEELSTPKKAASGKH